LRRFLSLAFACTLATFTGFAHAQQQIDIAVGGAELYSPKPTNASEAFPPPSERGGIYASVSAQVLFENHYGLSAESSWRYNKGLYNGFQSVRPMFTDVNGVFTHHLRNRLDADFAGGVGIETVIFYDEFSRCAFGSCPQSLTSNHFMMHLGAGFRYRVFRRFFVRPEANYYYIISNSEFHSGNVLRLGASFGYTFGHK
jgi:hypothetical protein